MITRKKRQRSNAWIREELRITSVFLELRIRRLKWLRCMLQNPEDNVQVRAAVAGRMLTRHG